MFASKKCPGGDGTFTSKEVMQSAAAKYPAQILAHSFVASMNSADIVDLLQRKLGTTGLVVSSAATLLVGAVFSYHLSLSYQRRGEAPIRWSWLPILGNALDLGVRPLEFLSECAEKHSDIFGMVVAGNRMFIIADVESCNVVLKPPKCLTWEEFHDIVLSNFFGANFSDSGMSGVHSFDENLMRKWYSNYLLR
jgi:hypothetical protein